MTEVRIRYEEDPEALPLGDVPFFDLDQVVHFLSKWGVNYEYDSDFAYGNITGEFVISDGKAYFEVMLGVPS